MFVQSKLASIILGALSTLLFVAVPYQAELNACGADGPRGWRQNGNASKGNGEGKGSKGGNSPSAKDGGTGYNKSSAGKGQSSKGSGKAASPSGARQSGSGNKSGATSSGAKFQQNPLTEGRIGLGRPSVAIRHSKGMKEEIKGGRYEMKDARGRTIVNRPATQSDLARLRGYRRWT